MDADEGLTDFKKAYADIILNTTKEAAAKIIVSERKASRCLYELNAAKEQGVQMLLLLKRMLDSKVREADVISQSQQSQIKQLQTQLQNAEDIINEAESVSMNQHKKVDELEAQLQEAEDIVKDLREDLRNVRAELEQLNNGKSHSEASHCPTITAASQSADGFGSSDLTYSYPSQQYLSPQPILLLPQPQQSEISSFTASNLILKGCNTNMTALVSNSNLPSIILRRKDESYRNRRTQRIRAFEEKLTAGELCLPVPLNDVHKEEEGGQGMSNIKVEKECESPMNPSYRKRKRASKYKRKLTSTETEREENCSKHSPVGESDAGILNTLMKAEELTDYGENLSVSPSKKEPEKTDVSNRLIKFTFQRKRKKETAMVVNSSDGTAASLENCSIKQIEPVKMKKQDGLLVSESSHDTRRAAQVARQLMSLSEKKW